MALLERERAEAALLLERAAKLVHQLYLSIVLSSLSFDLSKLSNYLYVYLSRSIVVQEIGYM